MLKDVYSMFKIHNKKKTKNKNVMLREQKCKNLTLIILKIHKMTKIWVRDLLIVLSLCIKL